MFCRITVGVNNAHEFSISVFVVVMHEIVSGKLSEYIELICIYYDKFCWMFLCIINQNL